MAWRTRITALIARYDRHLQRVAEETPPPRLRLVNAVALPWMAPLLVGFIPALLDLPRSVELALILPLTGVVMAGMVYATWRVTHHGVQFDRTPAGAWAETTNGQALVAALRRVTLNGLRGVTEGTALQRDLKLTTGDIAELLKILVADHGLDKAALLDRTPVGELTVRMLLDGTSRGGGRSEP